MAEPPDPALRTVQYKVVNLFCNQCSLIGDLNELCPCCNKFSMESVLLKMEGVRDARTDNLKMTATIRIDPAVTTPEKIRVALDKIGYVTIIADSNAAWQ